MQNGQGSLEYLILIGGALLAVIIVIGLILDVSTSESANTAATADTGFEVLKETVEPVLPGVSCEGGQPNNTCEATENCATCPADCSICPPSCRNTVCEPGETNKSCPDDCPA